MIECLEAALLWMSKPHPGTDFFRVLSLVHLYHEFSDEQTGYDLWFGTVVWKELGKISGRCVSLKRPG